jgi:hypothetical protein
MYIYPASFPPVSNREDWLQTVSIFDDDTGLPVELSGTTRAIPGAAFTSNAWTVIDGAIVTNSTTPITIPTFPMGNQLSALALTVGLGLGILAGDPITIQDTATGLNSMIGYVLSYAPATGALVVQIGQSFELEIRHWRTHRGGGFNTGYSTENNIGTYQGSGGPIISAQLGNGLSIVDIGYLQILIPVSVFGMLHAKTYLASMTMTDSINTRQLFAEAELPVIYGGVTRGALPNQTPASWANQF